MTSAPPPPPPGLAFGVVAGPGSSRIVAPLGDGGLLDVASLVTAQRGPHPELLTAPDLDALLGANRPIWTEVTQWLRSWLDDPERLAPHRLPTEGAHPVLPFTVADYVDFYACEQHARNAGLIFRPDAEPLAPNWKHLPVGYHGRAGTVPGQRDAGRAPERPARRRRPRPDAQAGPGVRARVRARGTRRPARWASTTRWTTCSVSCCSTTGPPATSRGWETRPLGPHLGKSFATSISAWVTPLDELAAAWTDPPTARPGAAALPRRRRRPGPGRHVRDRPELRARVDAPGRGPLLDRRPARRAPDVERGRRCGRATSSDPGRSPGRSARSGARCWSWPGTGRSRWSWPAAATRTYLEDGDEVVLTATAPRVGGGRFSLGEVRGRVLPARG